MLKLVTVSAVQVGGSKQFAVENNCKRVTAWWNQWVKDSLRANHVTRKAWLQNNANIPSISGRLRRENLQLLR